MGRFFSELNSEQLDGLARLCFDLAKGSLILALLPAPSVPTDPFGGSVKILVGLFWGLAFVYLALLILKMKERSI